MRPTRSRACSPRSGMLSTLGLILAVGLAIAIECQQLSRVVHSADARKTGTAASPAVSRSIPRAPTVAGPADPPSATAQPPWSLPVWKPGFQWHYRWSDKRGSGTYIRAITGEELVDGVPFYVMQTGNRNIYWGKNDLAWFMEQVNGQIESQAVPAYRKFVWPLEPGKTWVARYHWEHPAEGKTEERTRRHRIAGLESVQVPAGTYQALRVAVLDSGGKKVADFWYASEARWVVKERLYAPGGVRDRELIYASLWPNAATR